MAIVLPSNLGNERQFTTDGRSTYVSYGSNHESPRVAGLAGSWVELGTERESLLEVLDEDAYFS